MHNAARTCDRTQGPPRTSDVFERDFPLESCEIHCDEVNALARYNVRLESVLPADIEDTHGWFTALNRADDRERWIDVSARPTAGYDDIHSSFTILLKSRPRSS